MIAGTVFQFPAKPRMQSMQALFVKNRPIAAASPTVFQANDQSGQPDQPDQPLTQFPRPAGSPRDAFQVPEDMRPTELTPLDRIIVVAAMSITDQDPLEVLQQFLGGALAARIVGQKINCRRDA